MERTKLYKLIIAALVIINIGVLVFFLVGRPDHPGHRKMNDLAEKLELSGENAVKVSALEKEHHQMKQDLMKVDRELHEELFSKIGTDSDVTELQNKITSNYAETEKMTFTFFNEVSSYCSEEQKNKLKKTIRHAFRQMRGKKKE